MATKNIIFMIDIKLEEKKNRTDAYKYSIDSWKRWGEKNNAQIMVLNESLFDFSEMRPNWYKYYVFQLLEQSNIEYDQILYVDSDTIVHPNCPNVFEMSDRKYCIVHNQGSYDWLFRSMEIYSKYLFNNHMFDFLRYFNSGFMLFNKDHEPFYNAVLQFYQEHKKTILWIQDTYKVGTDQPIVNFLLDLYKIEAKFLPYEFNGQDLALHEGLTEDLLFWKFCYVAHFNALPNNHESKVSNHWMQYTYEQTWEK